MPLPHHRAVWYRRATVTTTAATEAIVVAEADDLRNVDEAVYCAGVEKKASLVQTSLLLRRGLTRLTPARVTQACRACESTRRAHSHPTFCAAHFLRTFAPQIRTAQSQQKL